MSDEKVKPGKAASVMEIALRSHLPDDQFHAHYVGDRHEMIHDVRMEVVEQVKLVIRELKAEKPEHWGGLRVDEILKRIDEKMVS